MSVNAKWGGRRREDKTKCKRRERKSCDNDDSLKDKSKVRGVF